MFEKLSKKIYFITFSENYQQNKLKKYYTNLSINSNKTLNVLIVRISEVTLVKYNGNINHDVRKTHQSIQCNSIKVIISHTTASKNQTLTTYIPQKWPWCRKRRISRSWLLHCFAIKAWSSMMINLILLYEKYYDKNIGNMKVQNTNVSDKN